MLLEEKTYKIKELAEWFEIQPNSFSKKKEQKLQELSDYADFTTSVDKLGHIRGITITKVKEPVYGMLSLGGRFLNWLDNGGIIEAQMECEDQIISYPVIINYYCQKNNIHYDGPHYQLNTEEGRTLDGCRKIEGAIREENKEFKEWHYLYRQIRKWAISNHFSFEDGYIDCCADSFNPVRLRITKPEDKKKRDEIYETFFGGIEYQDIINLSDFIEYYPEEYIDKQELLQARLIKRMSDKEKRKLAAQACVNNGVLFRKGYKVAGSVEE